MLRDWIYEAGPCTQPQFSEFSSFVQLHKRQYEKVLPLKNLLMLQPGLTAFSNDHRQASYCIYLIVRLGVCLAQPNN